MSQEDTVTKLKRLRTRAKTTQSSLASAKATVNHADRELSAARAGVEALDQGFDLTKKIGPQIDRAITEAEQELAEAEATLADINSRSANPA